MLKRDFALRFAYEWIGAWNRHDLDAVLSHYAEDFQMSSPYIAEFANVASGTLKGKAAVRAYWTAALEKLPGLRFELADTLAGAQSVILYYRGVRGMAAEIFQFDAHGKVVSAAAHYA
jgi:ketosteroid isomerase-like protein